MFPDYRTLNDRVKWSVNHKLKTTWKRTVMD